MARYGYDEIKHFCYVKDAIDKMTTWETIFEFCKIKKGSISRI